MYHERESLLVVDIGTQDVKVLHFPTMDSEPWCTTNKSCGAGTGKAHREIWPADQALQQADNQDTGCTRGCAAGDQFPRRVDGGSFIAGRRLLRLDCEPVEVGIRVRVCCRAGAQHCREQQRKSGNGLRVS